MVNDFGTNRKLLLLVNNTNLHNYLPPFPSYSEVLVKLSLLKGVPLFNALA